jgi:hypothetical protein
MKNVGTLMAIWYILWPFGEFIRFGMLHNVKSGNPGADLCDAKVGTFFGENRSNWANQHPTAKIVMPSTMYLPRKCTEIITWKLLRKTLNTLTNNIGSNFSNFRCKKACTNIPPNKKCIHKRGPGRTEGCYRHVQIML